MTVDTNLQSRFLVSQMSIATSPLIRLPSITIIEVKVPETHVDEIVRVIGDMGLTRTRLSKYSLAQQSVTMNGCYSVTSKKLAFEAQSQ